MAINIRFDARQVKQDVEALIDDKVKSVTTDPNVYTQMLLALKDTMKSYLPVDSGALADGIQSPHYSQCTQWQDNKGRVHNRTLYPRYGNTKVRSRSLEFEPYEERTNSTVYYANKPYVADQIYDAKELAQEDEGFINDVANIIVEKMRNG